jgi:long-chain acyl-CoA synthetase
LDALRTAASAAGVSVPADNAAMCADEGVKSWLLTNLTENNMLAPKWKGYEVARNIILDPVEWSVDNDMMTPSMKVKLRNLLSHHEEAINSL